MIVSEILLCCYVQLLVAFFWMWDWITTGLSYWLRHLTDLWSSTVTSELDPSYRWSQALLMSASGSPPHSQRSIFLFTLSSCLRIVALFSASMTFTVSPSLFASLSISLPTCSASVSQWFSEEELHSFGNLPLAMIWWVREQINSGNINRIFTSFHQPVLTGYSYPITPRGCGLHFTESLPLRWNSWEQEIGRLRSTCLVSEPLPTLPRDHPCSTVLAAHWVFGKSTAYLRKSAESRKWSWCIGQGLK